MILKEKVITMTRKKECLSKGKKIQNQIPR
jgi:hypothetical protein